MKSSADPNRRFAKSSIHKMKSQINTFKEQCLSLAGESNQNNRVAGETNNQILALKAKHEEEKERFEIEIKKLQDQLKERDDSIEFDDKSFKIGANNQGQGRTNKEEFANPIKILINRVNKIQMVNKKKKSLIDQYIKNAQTLEQVFN